MVCPSCGTTNDLDARFCKACGRGLAVPVQERRRLATSVFCDLSGSTALAERVDAEVLLELMASYYEGARMALERHGGLVEKFIGDAVVGLFGVPEAHEDDALRACRAALEIQTRVAELNSRLEQSLDVALAARIGVNTGEVIAGALGRRGMFATNDAVVLGDAVNVAARLEQAARPGDVLIGEPTFRFVRDVARVEAVAPVQARGKSGLVVAYRLLDLGAPGVRSRRGGAPLAGRDDELAALEREFEVVVTERSCRLACVVGEPGVGKSRLAAELIERVGARARTAHGGCLSYGEGITYWAIAQVVRELAGIRDDHSLVSARARLDASLEGVEDGPSVAAVVAQLLGIGSGSTTPEELAWALRRFLAARADGPIVAVIDDIQWAEGVMLELLASLPRTLSDTPILVLCLARPELRERAPDWAVTVALEGLGDRDLQELLAGLGAPEAVRGRLANLAAGNPLFAEELVSMLADEGALDASGLDRIELPDSLNPLLSARLDRLDESARAVLERAAIEGETFHRGAVVELSEDGSRDGVAVQLRALVDRDFVRPAIESFAGEAAFRFKHILVREVAYRGTAKKLRATLHEQFAGWLERVAGDRLAEFEEILGYHLEQAYRFRCELGPPGEEEWALGEAAAGHLVVAARRAAALSDLEAVAGLLRRALELGVRDPGQRVHLQFELGHALHQTRRVAEAEAVLKETHEQAARLGQDDVAALALVQRTWNRTGETTLDFDEAQTVAEHAIEVLTRTGDDRGLVLARRLRGIALAHRGHTLAAGAEFERALAHAHACGDKEARRLALGSFANAYLCGGPTPAEEAVERCAQLLELSRGDRVLEATVKRPLALLNAMLARAEEAEVLLDEAALVLDELSLRTSQVYRWVVAYARELDGDLAGAEREWRTMFDYFEALRRGRVDTRAMNAATELARFYCDLRRWDDAAEMLAYGGNVEQGDAAYSTSAPRLAVRARLAAHEGLAEAVPLARQAVAKAEARADDLRNRAETLLALAEVERSAGRLDEAQNAFVASIELYELKGNRAGATAASRRWTA
jgi:class 3 adenylate cyclase/predicted ATPase